MTQDFTEFDYFECPDCQFSSIQRADYAGSKYCPLCAGDSGHTVIMGRRRACSDDCAEGWDARQHGVNRDE